ncbi:MAG: DUF58 domain-containing protein [Pseudomonadota bacterium]
MTAPPLRTESQKWLMRWRSRISEAFAAGGGRDPGVDPMTGVKAEPLDFAALLDQAEHAAQMLPTITLGNQAVTQGFVKGAHARRRAGQGDSFWQFRRYHAGDPASAIDWRRSARSHRLYVRQNEWETAQTVYIWCDLSGSMAYRSADAHISKRRAAALLSLTIAAAVVSRGERVGYLQAGRRPAGGRFGLNQFANDMAWHERQSRAGTLGTALPKIDDALPPSAHVILVSDFLDDIESVRDAVVPLGRAGVRGHIVRVFDPAEAAFPFRGRTIFEGLEGEGQENVGRAEDLRKSYHQRYGAHMSAIETLARHWRFGYHALGCDRQMQPTVLALFMALAAEAPAFAGAQTLGEFAQ